MNTIAPGGRESVGDIMELVFYFSLFLSLIMNLFFNLFVFHVFVFQSFA